MHGLSTCLTGVPVHIPGAGAQGDAAPLTDKSIVNREVRPCRRISPIVRPTSPECPSPRFLTKYLNSTRPIIRTAFVRYVANQNVEAKRTITQPVVFDYGYTDPLDPRNRVF